MSNKNVTKQKFPLYFCLATVKLLGNIDSCQLKEKFRLST